MKCPYCGCRRFYVKDPEDEYEAYGFDCASGEICFDPEVDPGACPEITGTTRIYCDQCAWNGPLGDLGGWK